MFLFPLITLLLIDETNYANAQDCPCLVTTPVPVKNDKNLETVYKAYVKEYCSKFELRLFMTSKLDVRIEFFKSFTEAVLSASQVAELRKCEYIAEGKEVADLRWQCMKTYFRSADPPIGADVDIKTAHCAADAEVKAEIQYCLDNKIATMPFKPVTKNWTRFVICNFIKCFFVLGTKLSSARPIN